MNKKKYKTLLFDFDRTLWDVETNQKDAQRVIFKNHDIEKICPDFEVYYDTYLGINDRLWLEYRDGIVSREYLRNHRFVELLERLGAKNDSLAKKLSDEYISIAPSFCATIPHSLEVVGYLAEKYPLYIITNGFNEVQHLKLRNCGLDGFFRDVFTSEDAGANKPNRLIFDYALDKMGVSNKETIVIGDDVENDIIGAQGAGIDTVYFNPHRNRHDITPTYEITSLPELKDIL